VKKELSYSVPAMPEHITNRFGLFDIVDSDWRPAMDAARRGG